MKIFLSGQIGHMKPIFSETSFISVKGALKVEVFTAKLAK